MFNFYTKTIIKSYVTTHLLKYFNTNFLSMDFHGFNNVGSHHIYPNYKAPKILNISYDQYQYNL